MKMRTQYVNQSVCSFSSAEAQCEPDALTERSSLGTWGHSGIDLLGTGAQLEASLPLPEPRALGSLLSEMRGTLPLRQSLVSYIKHSQSVASVPCRLRVEYLSLWGPVGPLGLGTDMAKTFEELVGHYNKNSCGFG